MRQTREWINFTEIAEWCARETGSIRRDNSLLIEAYRELGEALASGEFEEDARSRVVYPEGLCLQGYRPWIRMTWERYEASLGSKPRIDVLECCWIPRNLCRRWFEARRIHLPPWLSSPEMGGDRTGAATSTTLTAPIRAESAIGSALSPVKATTRRDRGRRPKYNWTPVITGLGARLAADGLPEPGDGGQARYEKWVKAQFDTDNCPTESMIRAKVARTIEAHRHALNMEPNKAGN